MSDRSVEVSDLIDDYTTILKGIDINAFDLEQDKYSGVFLPVPFDEYWSAEPRIMIVGRETAGWNTNNGKNTMARALGLVDGVAVKDVVDEAIRRYRKHLETGPDGKLVTKSQSRFKQYFFKLAKQVGVEPKAIVYANLFAWDYNQKTPRTRPEQELNEIVSISGRLLAAQIRRLRPDVLVFAAGVSGIDKYIKNLFDEHFDGYENSAPVIPGRLWEFKAANAICYRIAHPRASHGHGKYRDVVIQRIKGLIL